MNFLQRLPPARFLSTAIPNRFASENIFSKLSAERSPLPLFPNSKELLPAPFWDGKDDVIACYWKTWELAFGNLRQPPEGSPLISNFLDTAFNGSTFMWDSAFMCMFGRYGHRAFNFQGTLDNFYARQHIDGYISREIQISDGQEAFEQYDLSSTGPNILPWAEWEHYLSFGDRTRLAKVFPALVAYAHWFKKHRSWPDGTYYSSGLGCGMDNQTRLPEGYDDATDHGHMSWIDTTLQQILSNRVLIKMAHELGRTTDVADLQEEEVELTQFVNTYLWSEEEAFYFDRLRDGSLSGHKSIGAYWALLAGVVAPGQAGRFIEHLRNPREFNRPHRVPTLSADDPGYERETGDYWRGGVWAPTNYMVLRGLTHAKEDALAHEIALNHLRNVVEVFKKTGTVWENYAPESPTQGKPAKPNFVGWTGLPPIAVLLEYVLGLRPDAARETLLWDIRLLEAHGVDAYPLGADTVINLQCAARNDANEEPVIKVSTNRPVTLTIRWACGEKTTAIKSGLLP